MKKTLAIMLALIMVLAMVPALADIGGDASEPTTGTKTGGSSKPGEAVKVTYTLDKDKKLISVEVTITSDAKDDVAVVLNNVLADALAPYSFNPGTKWTVNVTIKNESGKALKYDGLHVGTLQMEVKFKTGFKGYDGCELDLTQVAAIAFTHPAIEELFDTTKPTNQQLISMYETLKAKGFKGDEALSDYILDYYRVKYNNTNLTWDELVNDHLEDVRKHFSISGAASSITAPTTEELEKFEKSKLKNYLIKLFDNYWQVKWPEEKMAVLAYDLFYKDFFAVLFGSEAEEANPNGKDCELTRKRGVGDYVDKNGEAYKAANTYLSQLGDDGKLENGEEAQFKMALTLDGPYVGNQYALYDFIGALSLMFNFKIDTEVGPTPSNPPYNGGHYHPDPTPVPVIVIPPKTGDMTVWQSILHFLGIR